MFNILRRFGFFINKDRGGGDCGSWIYIYLCIQCLSPTTRRSIAVFCNSCIQHNFVIRRVNDLRQDSDFHQVLLFP